MQVDDPSEKILPTIAFETQEAFLDGSFVWPNPWMRAVGRRPGVDEPICRVGFGISPLQDRIYVDGLDVVPEFRRQGYGAALLLAVSRFGSNGCLLPITALHEVHASSKFWEKLRVGHIVGLRVTQDLRLSEMNTEQQRWRT